MPEPQSAEPQSTTVVVNSLLKRLAEGDPTARNALINVAAERLMIIARKLLRSFGGEARAEMWTADVVGEAFPRIAKSVDDVKPSTAEEFFGLAWLQMQRALLDQIYKLYGRKGAGDANGEKDDGTPPSEDDSGRQKKKPRMIAISQFSPQGDGIVPILDEGGSSGQRQIDLVIDLLKAMGTLPDKQRQTTWFKLSGFTHKEIGEILGVHHDTVDVYWSNAAVKLAKLLKPFMETQ